MGIQNNRDFIVQLTEVFMQMRQSDPNPFDPLAFLNELHTTMPIFSGFQ